MGTKIDKHFFSELFDEKKVKCYNNIYLLLFDKIWPSIDNFKGFLNSSDKSLKIEYAKKIYNEMSLNNILFLPPSTILNVLKNQTKKLKDSINFYIPQDHVIHSINLYILGIYVFFNLRDFNYKFTVQNGINNYYYTIRDFVLKWQVFALYHDIGYYFEESKEGCDFVEKDLEVYKNLYNSLIHNFIMKNTSISLTFKKLAEKSWASNIEDIIKNDISNIWYDINDDKINSDLVNNYFKKFDKSVSIVGVSNDEELIPILPLINNKEYLVVVYDEFGCCIALIERQNLTLKKYYSKNINLKDQLFINNILNTSSERFRFQYYINDLNKSRFWRDSIDSFAVVDDLLPAGLNNYFSVHSDNIEKILLKVYGWLSRSLINEEKGKLNECFKKSILQNLIDKVNRLDKENVFDVQNIELEKFKKTLSDQIDENFIEKIKNDANKSYNYDNGSSFNFKKFYNSQSKIIENEFLNTNYIKSLQFFDLNNFKDKKLLNYDTKNTLQNNLINYIKSLSAKLNIKFSELINYTAYGLLDHGIASACILFQAAAFNSDVRKYCLENSKLVLAWDALYNEEEYIRFCSECIFSVMLHNIYDNKSDQINGLDYHQDIDINPFSYFCAFCDNIQSWGRPKQIDQSQINIPKNNYLEDEFDIEIKNDKIIVKCLEKDMVDYNKKIQNSKYYLPGIDVLIKVEQFN